VKAPARTKLTPPELAQQWGVSADQIVRLIRAGELSAVNVALRTSGRPRFLIDVESVREFDRRRSCAPVPKVRRRRVKDSGVIEFFR
jgi:hypothetical protein